MTSSPDRQRRATTWAVIGVVVVLAVVATLLVLNLLGNVPVGTGPTATESLATSATSGPSATLLASVAASATPEQSRAPGWTATGPMIQARLNHTATLLPDGKVLVAGGGSVDSGQITATAELYDPRTGTWTATGSMIEARWSHTATLLPDGRVLVAGGFGSSSSFATLASAELYDPASGSWTVTGSMSGTHAMHTATRLEDGKVLVAGGTSGEIGYLDDLVPLASAELYDPGTGGWTATGDMIGAGLGAATLLGDGTVLGVTPAELYDPGTAIWTATPNMVQNRGRSTATLLTDGRVLVTGGGGGPAVFDSAELYDPGTGTWNATGNMGEARYVHTATLLRGGNVLVAGAPLSASAEVFDPGRGTWTATAAMIEARGWHTATLLLDDTVLVAGGSGGGVDALASAERYDPGSGS